MQLRSLEPIFSEIPMQVQFLALKAFVVTETTKNKIPALLSVPSSERGEK